MGCALQIYMMYMAIKDGLILISLSKRIQCISQRTLLLVHCVVQVIDIMALIITAVTVCMQNVNIPMDDEITTLVRAEE